MSVDAQARLSAMPALCSWVDQNGGASTAVQAITTSSAQGLGLQATRSVRRGQALLSVPDSLAITAESALRSDLGMWLEEFDPELADYSFIALALLHEKRLGDQSAYAGWLQSGVWPAGPDLPLLWTQESIEQLTRSTTAPVAQRLQSLQADYEWLSERVFAASPIFFPSSVFSLDEFRRAVALVFSRSIIIPVDKYDRPALLPLFDLPNHSDKARAAVQRKDSTIGLFGGKGASPLIQLIALEDFDPGDEVCTRYPGITRAEMLLDFGFVQEPVPTEASIELWIEPDDVEFDDKFDVLELAGLSDVQTFLLSEQGEVITDELLAFLRLRHLSGADSFLLEAIFREVVWLEHLSLPVSEANEKAALSDGLTQCSGAIDALTGSVQADLALLAEADRASVEYRLAAIRYAERRALQAAVRVFQAKLNQLKNLEYYQERRLRSLNLNPIETEEELDALREESTERAAGRSYGRDDYEW